MKQRVETAQSDLESFDDLGRARIGQHSGCTRYFMTDMNCRLEGSVDGNLGSLECGRFYGGLALNVGDEVSERPRDAFHPKCVYLRKCSCLVSANMVKLFHEDSREAAELLYGDRNRISGRFS